MSEINQEIKKKMKDICSNLIGMNVVLLTSVGSALSLTSQSRVKLLLNKLAMNFKCRKYEELTDGLEPVYWGTWHKCKNEAMHRNGKAKT